MAGPNPAWKRRPANLPWHAEDEARLAQVVADGLMIECAAPIFPGHDFGDILARRTLLIHQGRAQLAADI